LGGLEDKVLPWLNSQALSAKWCPISRVSTEF
jgi:hypothetical protein